MAAAGALWTGAQVWEGRRFGAHMTGLFPPHYGYSAYLESVAPFLGGPAAGLFCIGALVLSANRCAWMGLVAGWGYLGGKERRWACAALGALALLAVNPFKPAGTNGVRLAIWEQAVLTLWNKPEGFGVGGWCTAAKGLVTDYAHSDVLQILLVLGIAKGLLVLLAAATALWLTLRGRQTAEKAALVCLAAQSVTDNRLHRPACIVTLLLVWALALASGRRAAAPRASAK